MLEQHGYEVSVARDGAEALGRLSAGAAGVDVLVSDVRMAGVSGTELVARLRALQNELPVLLLSGYSGEDLEGVLHRTSGCAFLQKPFSPDALVTALEELLADAKPPATAG
jgi:CheY-like chemotaxis protein